MKITLFGATGHVGSRFMKRALDEGHEVVAYVRNPKKLMYRHGRLSVVVGTLSDGELIEQAVRGADVVVSVVGPLGWQSKEIFAPAYEYIVAAMKKNHVTRLIALGTPSIPDEEDRFHPVFWTLIVVVGFLLGKGYRDIVRVGTILRTSGLDWTLVRVPLLTDRAARGDLVIGYFGNGVTWPWLTREDFVDFLMRELLDRNYIGKAPAISNRPNF